MTLIVRFGKHVLPCLALLAAGCAALEKDKPLVDGGVGGAAPDGAAGPDAPAVGDGSAGDASAVAPDAPSITASIPHYDEFKASPHANASAEPFAHWNAEGTVPVECARCHSSQGFIDYVGGDGTAARSVERTAPAPNPLECQTCHNAGANALSSVTFPSGTKVDGLGGEARCMTCHQGRASGADVDAAITKAGVTMPDQPSPMLSFLNIHYYPAAATLYAGRAKGGYQYAGQVYDVRFRHVEQFDTCIECHDPHTTKVRFDACGGCHQGVKDGQGARTIRMMSSFGRDYDGDGDVSEGISAELDGSRARLLAAMQTYGRERAAPLCYSAAVYPYIFADKNSDGQCGADETTFANAYKAWTPRLMRAAYNYQMATKDPGAFAHNAKYILELLYDSVQDLNAGLTAKVDLAKAARTDVGHFNGASEAARHWDADEAVSADCSRCHSGEEGFRFFAQYGVGTKVPETANGLECGTCHTSFGTEFKVLDVAKTPFPGGITLMQPGRDNLCGTCHAGRASKATVDAAIASNKLGFINVHYLPAAATKAGASAAVGYQYAGKTYAGPLVHQGGIQCTSCHDPVASQHTFRVTDAWQVACRGCHADANGDPKAIRLVHKADYDGDGNATESLSAEIDGLAAKLLAAMRAAAPGLCYSADAYPYFFAAAPTGPATCAAADAVAANGFKAWTPDLVRASFNYQLARKEPGGWAHNFDYVAQLLYDSIEAMGGQPAVAGLLRP